MQANTPVKSSNGVPRNWRTKKSNTRNFCVRDKHASLSNRSFLIQPRDAKGAWRALTTYSPRPSTVSLSAYSLKMGTEATSTHTNDTLMQHVAPSSQLEQMGQTLAVVLRAAQAYL